MSEEIKKELLPIQTQAQEIIITNNEHYQDATAFLLRVKALRSKINDTFDPIIQKNHDAHKMALSQKKTHTAPLDEAETQIKRKISGYLAECEKKRLEEQRRLQIETRKKQEEMALLQAQNAETEIEAEQIIQEAIEINPVVISPKIQPKVEGITEKKVWKYNIVNPALVKKEFMVIDEKKIGAMVRSLGKNAESFVGGIQVYQETIIAARSR